MAIDKQHMYDTVAFNLGEKSMEDEALMEVLSNGQAALVTHLIMTVVDLTAKYLEPINE